MSATPYRSTVTGSDGFRQLLMAEWVKIRSVPRWGLAMVAAVVVTCVVSLLTASASSVSSRPSAPPPPGALGEIVDEGHFVFRPLAGDVTISARVLAQDDSQEWAKAGLMVRQGPERGSPYVAVMVTPGHGVRLQHSYTEDQPGGPGAAPRWLRLTRSETVVTALESADGTHWTGIGTVRLPGLGATAEVGVFVASPGEITVRRQFGGESVDGHGTVGRATFADLSVEQARPQAPEAWRERPGGPGPVPSVEGTFELVGMGDMGRFEFADDVTRSALSGVFAGLIAFVVLGALFISAEYARGTIRTTFTASPRRGRVLAAKAIVLGLVSLVVGLVAAFAAFLLSAPILHKNGTVGVSLSDGTVLRAVVGSGLVLAVIALFSLGVAAIVRRAAVAITVVLLFLLVPQIIGTGLPLGPAMWLERLTPSAGLAMLETVRRHDTAIGPWAGFAVLCGYALIALGLAFWHVRREDV